MRISSAAVVLRQFSLAIILLVLQNSAMRLLYLTAWRNVGSLNDDLFLTFFKATIATFTALNGAYMTFFRSYEGLNSFVLCSGVRKASTSFENVGDIKWHFRLTVFVGVTSVLVLFRER